jgi:predicted esterase
MDVNPLIIRPATVHKFSCIFLHGLGDTCNGWAPVARELSRKFTNVRWVLPTAKTRSVTLNFGMACPAWYDILGLTPDAKEDETGMRASRDAVHNLIEEEKKLGIPARRIFVGGFSQGGAIALLSALTYKEELGGILALSTYLPKVTLKEMSAPAAHIWMAHGTADGIVQYRWGSMSRDALKERPGVNVAFKEYDGMQHEACMEEITDMGAFMESRMSSAE